MKLRVLAVATAALLVMIPTQLASAAPPAASPTILANGLIGPLHLSVGAGNAVTVSESFGGTLTTVDKGTRTVTYQTDRSLAGSDYQGSRLFFLESIGAGPEDPRPLEGALRMIDAQGTVTTITDQLGAYETNTNPDQAVWYGLSEQDMAMYPQCVAEMGQIGFPAGYYGAVDSHPYAVAVTGNTAYIADAGANAVLAVQLNTGEISTVAVLPPRPAVITEEAATAFGIPSCIGLTYNFESVPTDVEVGPGGWLYVSSLPGGPEDASLGARGAVFQVNAATGEVRTYVEGILSPTGIALDAHGNLYVASLFGAGIYRVDAGTTTPVLYLSAEFASDVEVKANMLYATINAFTSGTLISQPL